MGEPLKNIYNIAFLNTFAEKISTAYKDFDETGFIAEVMAPPWDELELKARIRCIAKTLGKYLPNSFEKALKVLFQIDESCNGFPYLIFPDFVEIYGQQDEHWELSMFALERFTQRSSSEFAIRPFLLKEPERVMERMLQWAEHPNEHVRRLSSEGCRPRLPWGVSLPVFKNDPSPVLIILDKLKADTSLYVRKSVANNLNDIAKDNPDSVIDIAHLWMGSNPEINWIVRQGCRTLIKKTNPKAMALFGYAEFSDATKIIKKASLSIYPKRLKIGESCELEYKLLISGDHPIHIRMEYGIDFVKANGKTSRKLFLLKDKNISGKTDLSGVRSHSFADLTTRRHYEGEHRIALLVNGYEVAHTTLKIKGSTFSGEADA